MIYWVESRNSILVGCMVREFYKPNVFLNLKKEFLGSYSRVGIIKAGTISCGV